MFQENDIRGVLLEAAPDMGAAEMEGVVKRLKTSLNKRSARAPEFRNEKRIYRNITFPATTTGTQIVQIPVPTDRTTLVGYGFVRTDAFPDQFNLGIKWPNEEIDEPVNWRVSEVSNIQIANTRFIKKGIPRQGNTEIYAVLSFDVALVNPIAGQLFFIFGNE